MRVMVHGCDEQLALGNPLWQCASEPLSMQESLSTSGTQTAPMEAYARVVEQKGRAGDDWKDAYSGRQAWGR